MAATIFVSFKMALVLRLTFRFMLMKTWLKVRYVILLKCMQKMKVLPKR